MKTANESESFPDLKKKLPVLAWYTVVHAGTCTYVGTSTQKNNTQTTDVGRRLAVTSTR